MNQPLLVLDSHFLCYRAFYSMGGLAYGGKPTGVIFGFLQTIGMLKEEFQTDRVAFCFEHPHLFRRDIFPEYKLKRRLQKSPEEMKAFGKLAAQIKLLRTEYLPKIGFKNIFSFDGYESDDIMAVIAADTTDDQDCILVTADSDLLQCLANNVTIYSPQNRKTYTKQQFENTHGIRPSQWAVVKAIAGCSTDGVPGVGRVGEIGAIKFIKKQLPKTTIQYQAITCQAGCERILRNRLLVELPYANCPSPKLRPDKVTVEGWREVCAALGFKSLIGQPPIHVRAKQRIK